MYIVTLVDDFNFPGAGCNTSELVLVKVDPTGNQTTTCIQREVQYGGLNTLNQELNSIISQGYKLIETSYALDSDGGDGSLVNNGNLNPDGATFIFAIPWSASGLEEVSTTLKSFIISPNPANTFVDISLDYSLKGESEVVFISEAGYIYHKQNIQGISKNKKYNIDISKIPHPTVIESLELLGHKNESSFDLKFIHLNHTNPLLDDKSVELKKVNTMGWDIAKEGESFII